MASFARWTLLVLLVLALFGAGLGDGLVGGIVQVCSILVLLLCLLANKDHLHPFYSVPGIRPLGALAILILFQLLPLPPFLLELFSPATSRFYAETVWIVLPDSWMPLSLVPKATLRGFFLLISCGALYVAAIQLHSTLEKSKRSLIFLTAGAELVCLLGLAKGLFGSARVGGSIAAAALSADRTVFGWGVGGDYSTLLAMVLPAMVGLYLALQHRSSDLWLSGQRFGPWTLSPQQLRVLVGVTIVSVLGMLLISSQSWTLLLTLGGLLLLAALIRSRGKRRTWGAVMAAGAVFLLLGGVFFRWGGGTEGPRLDRAGMETARVGALGEDWLGTFSRFPLVGIGLGTSYDLADPSAPVNQGRGLAIVGQSHLGRKLAEVGTIGAILSVWFFYSVLRQSQQAWLRRKSRTSTYLFSGVLAGVVIFLAHSLTDRVIYPLPLGIYVSLWLGLLVTVSHSSARVQVVNSDLRLVPPSVRKTGLMVGGVLGLALIAFCGGGWMARMAIAHDGSAVAGEGGKDDLSASMKAFRLAARLDPLESHYPRELGEMAFRQGDNALALEYFATALKFAPLGSQVLQKLGMIFNLAGDEVKTEGLLRAAAEYHPGNLPPQKEYALWLCSHSRLEDAFPYLQRSFDLEPERAGELLIQLSAHGLATKELEQALAENPTAWAGYGDFLLSRGAEKEAETSYVKAVRYAIDSKRRGVFPFLRLIEFYSAHDRTQEALDTTLSGLQLVPQNPQLRLTAASLYQKLGITYRAIEEYNKTLLLEPDNELARMSLKVLTQGE